jgi:hypothetical protein
MLKVPREWKFLMTIKEIIKTDGLLQGFVK